MEVFKIQRSPPDQILVHNEDRSIEHHEKMDYELELTLFPNPDDLVLYYLAEIIPRPKDDHTEISLIRKLDSEDDDYPSW